MAFLSINRLQGFSRLAVQVSFLAAGILYAVCDGQSDWYYGQGLRTGSLADFQRSSSLFPLIRSHREAPAYWAGQREYAPGIKLIQEGLKTDPYAADLLYNLARLQLQSHDEADYNVSLARLKALTPQHTYLVIGPTAAKGE